MGDIFDDLRNAGSSLQKVIDAKTKKLDNALTLITILSGVAALAGVVTVLRGRR